jgi:hypothetical protein
MVRRVQIAVLMVLGVLLAMGVASASAAPSDPFAFKGSFDVSSTPEGSFSAGYIAVNHQTGNVLVVDNEHRTVHQFSPTGEPVDFTGLGSPTISIGDEGFFQEVFIAVDNTGGSTQGNIYLFQAGRTTVYGYASNGNPLAKFPINPSLPGGGTICGGSIAPNGNIWVGTGTFVPGYVTELTPTGTATGLILELGEVPPFGNCSMALDGVGNLYFTFEGQPTDPFPTVKFGSGSGHPRLGPTGDMGNGQIAIDPSTNDVYSDHRQSITGIRYSDPLVKSTPFETLSGLNSGGIAFDTTGQTLYAAEGSKIDIFHREPPVPPTVIGPTTSREVRSRSASINWAFNTGGAATSYYFEFGSDTSYGARFPASDAGLPFSFFPQKISKTIDGLQPGTTYHLRVVEMNSAGTIHGPDVEFTTYAAPPGGPDPCPNALARKQTSARTLLDCRAYELVSAADPGGYDVESSLVPGQAPFGGYPGAAGRVLYGVHAGAIPGVGNPTNRGPDPYVATRGENGWSTSYVGIPANVNKSTGPFSSSLGEADPQLSTFAFAGSDLCKPCFTNGIETGIPVRLPNGNLVQGMAGSLDPGPSAESSGYVARRFSADGRHLIFGSTAKFEPDANPGGLTIYDRDLGSGVTHVVSKTTAGGTMSGEVGELDLSADGSRVVVGEKVSTDSAGNAYWHPFMDIGDAGHTVDLAPGSTSGVLFAGMSVDGSRVFFTTVDKLLPADTDSSADLYAADVDAAGNVTLSLVSAGNSIACSPAGNSNGAHWNAVGPTADCGTVAIGGGGGVASQSGTVYFLSPEQLDGSNGTLDQPNLYRASSGGPPSFVATLEPDNPLVLDSVKAAASRRTADFQVTPGGGDAVFASALSLTGATTNGNGEVFRNDSVTGLDCVSCDPTQTAQPSGSGDAALAPNGLSITDDGRVFFTTPLALVLYDTNSHRDVYEWAGGAPQLISAGTSYFDSGLLGVSADGTDAYFFTHDMLAPTEDHTGTLTKIYDARSGGGFFVIPPPQPCAAADECHGAGTPQPGPPTIGTGGSTTPGNEAAPSNCRKGTAKKRGKCVKKKGRQAKKTHKRHGRGGKKHA